MVVKVGVGLMAFLGGMSILFLLWVNNVSEDIGPQRNLNAELDSENWVNPEEPSRQDSIPAGMFGVKFRGYQNQWIEVEHLGTDGEEGSVYRNEYEFDPNDRLRPLPEDSGERILHTYTVLVDLPVDVRPHSFVKVSLAQHTSVLIQADANGGLAHADGKVYELHAGDINRDGVVDSSDVDLINELRLAKRIEDFGLELPPRKRMENWRLRKACDFDLSGEIDARDMELVTSNLGETTLEVIP